MVSSLMDSNSQQGNDSGLRTPQPLKATLLDRWNSPTNTPSSVPSPGGDSTGSIKTKRLSPFWNCSYMSSSFLISDPSERMVNTTSIKKQNAKSIKDYKERNEREKKIPKRVPSRGMSIRTKPPALQDIVSVENNIHDENSELSRSPHHNSTHSVISFKTSDFEKKMIRKALKRNLLFQKMDSGDRNEFVDAFEHIEVEKGTRIVTQGDPGDFFYIVGMDSIVEVRCNGAKVKELEDFGSFGELALIYSCRREATVVATSSPTDLFRVDRNTFKTLLRQQIKAKEEQKNRLLREVDFLSEMSDSDLITFGQAMTLMQFLKDDILLKEGDEDDAFHILNEGELRATNISVRGTNFDDVTFKPGEYFGEHAPASDDLRQVTVVATTDGSAFRIERQTFEKLMSEFSRVETKSQDIELLEGIEMFKSCNLTKQQYEELANLIVDKEFERKEKIFVEGRSTNAALYFVREGSVKISGGRTAIIGPGAYFGENLLLLDTRQNEETIKGAPTKIFARSSAVTNECCLCGVLTLSDCRTIFDTSKLSKVNHGDGSELSSAEERVKSGTSLRPEGLEVLMEESSSEFSQELKSNRRISVGSAFIPGAPLTDESEDLTTGAPLIDESEDLTIGAPLTDESEDLTTEEHGSQKPKRSSSLISSSTAMSSSRASTHQWLTKVSKNGLRRAVKQNIKLEDLKKREMLGEGQYGQVFLVSADVSPAYGTQLFALKTQKKNDSRRGDTYDIIKREIDLLSRMDHPYIVNLVHYYEKPDEMHILMGAVYGGELFDVIHTENADGTWSSGIPESDAKFYAMVITDTLDYIHRKQFVYRDLKPENVLIDENGYPIICDFGFAKIVRDKTYTLCGTPNYLSPEIIMNIGHNASTDHWALGILIYEMVAGENPFYYDGISQMDLLVCICQDKFYPLPNSASNEVFDVVDGLLQKDPTLRLGSKSNRGKDILAKKWFDGLNLDDLRQKNHPAPYIPDNEMMDGLIADALSSENPGPNFASIVDNKRRSGRESGCRSSFIK